jgi:hypothetical protein
MRDCQAKRQQFVVRPVHVEAPVQKVVRHLAVLAKDVVQEILDAE